MRSIYRSNRGQALAEFVIILTIFMIVISGMLYFFRLHLYQFWAQQEARYLAFEETWVPRAYYKAEGEEPLDFLTPEGFKRPGVVTGLGATRNKSNFGSMTDLIPELWARNEPEDSSIFSTVSLAYAGQQRSWKELAEIRANEKVVAPSVVPDLDEAIRDRLKGFGENFCSTARIKLGEVAKTLPPFSALDCASRVERDFSRTLVRETNIPELFREISDRVGYGEQEGAAMRTALSSAVASGFYSYFSNEVQSRFDSAPTQILIERGDAAIDAIDSSISRMISDLRYIGSTAAILALLGEGVAIGGSDYNDRSSTGEKSFEEGLQTILHIDAANILPIIGDGYLLNPMYLPVPPKFGSMAGGFFSGTMRSVLSLDSDEVDELIDNSVRRISVTYDSANGLFSGATRRFKTGAKLSANFVIDTNPWHLERRLDGTGPYAQKGEEFDTVSDDTEEGRLRRRVSGLWLFPTPPDAFFDPILAFVGLEELSALVDAFRPVGDIISQIKSLLTNNPLFEIFNALSELPVIGSIFPKIPVWPVVRPDAYPTSTEMDGDRKMGENRNFIDYVNEQREFNPKPEPEFDD